MANTVKATVISTKVVDIRQEVDKTNNRLVYFLVVEASFDGKRKNRDGDIVDASIDYIVRSPRQLIDELCALNRKLAVFRKKKSEHDVKACGFDDFGAAELYGALEGATIKFERTPFKKDDEYTDMDGKLAIHEHDGWDTTFTELVLTEDGTAYIAEEMAFLRK